MRVLSDFAHEGRQLLFFTCHDHILRLFEAAQADIRILPAHGTPGTRVSKRSQPVELPAPSIPVVESDTPRAA